MIREDMQFVGLKDFYVKSKEIREKYKKLNLSEKWRYKYYVYSRVLLKDFYKDMIWEYLNEEKQSPFYVFQGDLKRHSEKVRI